MSDTLSPDYFKVNISDTSFLDDPSEFDRAYLALPEFRRERVDKYENAEVCKQSVAAFLMLMRGLNELGIDTSDKEAWAELAYSEKEHGKPYFAGRPDIHFSLSHTKGAVICAVSGSEVGCDIEHIFDRKITESLTKRVLTQREIEACHDQAQSGVIDPSFFLRIWTAKEAWAKYTGEGLRKIMSGFDSADIPVNVHFGDTAFHVWSVCSECTLLS